MSSNEAIIRTAEQPNSRTRNSALKILVCYHKPYTMPPNDDGIFFPIQCGKTLTDTDLHIQGDNELNGQPCDNISSKNPSYSELTALYWAWKNLKKLYPDVQYVGLCHYRRFFAFDEKEFLNPDILKPEDDILKYRLNAEKIFRILESGRSILVKKYTFSYSVAIHYCMCHFSGNYGTLKDIIREKYPEYFDEFVDVMERNNKLFARNMFIMNWKDFEKYCEWLFSILFEVDERIHYQEYGTYQMRVPAFMAERLFNVYVRKNKIRAKYLNIYFYDKETKVKRSRRRKFLAYINRLFCVSRDNLAMFILNLNLNPISRLLKKVFYKSPLKH